jgi:hypothetical protein
MDRISNYYSLFNRNTTSHKIDVILDICKDLAGKGKDRNSIFTDENNIFKVRKREMN